MIKRSTAYFFILLTSIVLLAHAIIPHHHHESEIFIVSSDCQTDKGAHKHGATQHNHDEHDDTNDENCIIQQVVVVRSNQIEYELKSQDNQDDNSQIDGFNENLSKKHISIPSTKSLSEAYTLLSSTYLNFASKGLGLRAPPKVV